jgi:Ca-activated chloride channel homolog
MSCSGSAASARRASTAARAHGVRRGAAVRRVRAFVLLLGAFPLVTGWSFFDPFHENVEKGNRKADAGEPDEALARYQEAAKVDPSSPIPDFNRGIVLSGKGDTEKALDAFRAASASEDPQVAADALYNMGNVYMQGEQYEPAIDSYLKSLDLDPDDADARRNFELALRKLQEQQQQQQQQQQQDQDKDQDQDQKQDPQDQKDQPEQEPQEDDQQQSPDQQQEQDKEPQEQPQPDEEKLSREDAERLLNAVQSDELKVLEQLQQKEPPKGVVTRDW